MSDICSKIINEINNKNFNTALKLSGGYSITALGLFFL